MGSRPGSRGAEVHKGSDARRSSNRANAKAPNGNVDKGPRFSSFHCR